MWNLKNDVNEGDLVPIAQLQSPKEHREEELAIPWSYQPLSEDQLRWYWIKQPFSLQGQYLYVGSPAPSTGVQGCTIQRPCSWCIPAHGSRTWCLIAVLLSGALHGAAIYSQDIQHRAYLQRFAEEDNRTLERAYRYLLLTSY